MKVVVIDHASCSIDFAQRITTAKSNIEKVYVFSSCVAPSTWNTERLEVIESDYNTQVIDQFISQNNIALLINFNSVLGMSGFLEQQKEKGIAVFGTGRAFAETEIEKQKFKHWLQENKFRTPDIHFESLLGDLKQKLDTFNYPIVVKPDIQCGPQTLVCSSKEELSHYIDKTIKDVPIAEKGVVFIVEDYIASDQVTQIEYMIGNGSGFVVYSCAAIYGNKSQENITGASCALSPSPIFAQHEATIKRFVAEMAKLCDYGIGMFQAIVSDTGDFYILENNARPSACRLWPEMKDPIAVVNGLREGSITDLSNRDCFYKRDAYMASILMVHREAEKIIDLDRLSNIENIEFTPHSVVKKDDIASSVQGKPPSVFSVYANDYSGIEEKLRGARGSLEIDDITDVDNILGELGLLS